MQKLLSLFFSIVLLVSCEGTVVNEFCKYSASYKMDFSIGHTNIPLHDALNSSNLFATFSTVPYNSGYKIQSHTYGSGNHTEVVSEEILSRSSRIIGLNNGLIVGRSSLQDGQLYVFDQMCPNCYKSNNFTRNEYMLSFVDNGTNAECSACKRKYGLLNGGVVVAGEQGEKLFRYHASYDGRIFWVANPQ